MRALLVGLAGLLLAPAGAGAAFAPPVSIPTSGAESPVAIAFAAGRGVLVTQAGGEPYGRATQHTITIPGGRRETSRDTAISTASPVGTAAEVFTGALSILRGAGPEELVSAGPVSSPLLGSRPCRRGRARMALRRDAAGRRRPAATVAGEARHRGRRIASRKAE